MMTFGNCLKTGYQIGSIQWNKSPACECEKCSEFFRQIRLGNTEASRWIPKDKRK